MAADRNAFETAVLLINNGADIHAKNADSVTPLHEAASGDSYNIAELLIARGAKIQAIDDWGGTPLHYAAEVDSYDVAKLLIENGADVNSMLCVTDVSDVTCEWSPLHATAWRTAPKVAELLLKSGANINALDEDGCSPTDLVYVHDDFEEDRNKVKSLFQRYSGRRFGDDC